MKKYLILIVSLFVAFIYAGALTLAAEDAGAAKAETTSDNKPSAKPDHTTMTKPETTLEDNQLSGKVVETMDSGGYSYVLLETTAGQLWVAVPKMKVIKGKTISFMPGVVMENFESKTLKRKFERIIFSGGPLKAEGAAKEPHSAAKEPQSMGSKGNVVKPTEKISVEKASGPNAYTVEELFKKSGSLDKKAVVIRAKVVKVSQGIMDRNWIHIQDGTGNVEKGNGDLVVTTKEVPTVGDTVTVNGTLAKDKDFGSGYKYKVIVEDGTFKK